MKNTLLFIAFSIVLAGFIYWVSHTGNKTPPAQGTPIPPLLVTLSGPSFRESVKLTTQEEKIMLGTWYLTPTKPPAENYLDVKTVDGKTLHVARSQVQMMLTTAE